MGLIEDSVNYKNAYFPKTPAPYKEAWVRRKGYTEPYIKNSSYEINNSIKKTNLSVFDYGKCIFTASAITALLSRPISQLFRFHFITDIPSHLQQQINEINSNVRPSVGFDEKKIQFFRVIFSTYWWRNGSSGIAIVCATYCFILSFFTFAVINFDNFCLNFKKKINFSLRKGKTNDNKGLGNANSINIDDEDKKKNKNIEIDLQNHYKNWPWDGIFAGGLTGLVLTLIRHPIDVLRTTADNSKYETGNGASLKNSLFNSSNQTAVNSGKNAFPKVFKGPFDVFLTALMQKPRLLFFELYKGFTLAAIASVLQCTAIFGIYTIGKYDAVRNGDAYLYALCHLSSYIGHMLQFPFHNLKQGWLAQREMLLSSYSSHSSASSSSSFVNGKRSDGRFSVHDSKYNYTSNLENAGKNYTMIQHFKELRRRHGVTKVYDGFFRFSPFWSSAPAAIALFCYDKFTRNYTEYLYPERTKANALGQSGFTAW